MPKRSPRRQSFGFSPSTGKVQNYNMLPAKTKAQVLAHQRKVMQERQSHLLESIMTDIRRVEASIEASRKSPAEFQADMKRRLQKIRKKLSGKKTVMFHPSAKKTSGHRVMR